MKYYEIEESNEILDVVKKIVKYSKWVEKALCEDELGMRSHKEYDDDDDEEDMKKKYKGTRYSRY